jgi:hypothetical protein
VSTLVYLDIFKNKKFLNLLGIEPHIVPSANYPGSVSHRVAYYVKFLENKLKVLQCFDFVSVDLQYLTCSVWYFKYLSIM